MMMRSRSKTIYESFRKYGRSKVASFGLVLLSFFVALAILAPLLTPYSPFDVSAGPTFAPLFSRNLLGTDDLGRDIFSRLLYGLRSSLLVGLTVAFVSSLLGTFIGSISGYRGGFVDEIIMRITEMFQVIPRFVLAMILLAVMGRSFSNIILTLCVLSWPRTARIVRSEFLKLKNAEFVEAAKALGLGDLIIMYREILPNAINVLTVASTFQMADAILVESGLSFMGLGDPSVVSLGLMMRVGLPFLREAFSMSFFPGMGVFLIVLGFNLIGDGLSDVLNPRIVRR